MTGGEVAYSTIAAVAASVSALTLAWATYGS